MEWIQQAVSSQGFSLAALAAAVMLGAAMAVGSCCNLPVLAAVVGYAGSRDQEGKRGLGAAGLGFFVGTLLAMAALGLALGMGSRFLGALSGPWGRIAAGFAFLLFGLWALGLVPARLPNFAFKGTRHPSGMAGALLFGLIAGGATALCSLSCSAPLVPVLAGLASARGSGWWGAIVMLAVAFGYGLALTLVLLGFSAGRLVPFMKKIENGVRLVSGLALVAAGYWLLANG